MKAMEHIEKFDGRCQLYVWICQIAKNTYFSYQKRQKRFVNDRLEFVHPERSPEESCVEKEVVNQLYSLLEELPDPYREVFSLRVFGELSFSQIGTIFGKTDSWARLVYHRAKIKLKEDLDE